MQYNHRELLGFFNEKIQEIKPSGFILSGIVGCGKTTLVNELIGLLEQKHIPCLSFTGDDVRFRKETQENSQYLLDQVLSKTTGKAFIFVDEVQKCEEIFDALKIAFDSQKVSFIVSGSNPAYLSTVAKKKLQRRASFIYMLPFALSEILIHKNIVQESMVSFFKDLVYNQGQFEPHELPPFSITKENENLLKNEIEKYFVYGGLPLSYLSESIDDKLKEIKLTVERGFELISVENNLLHDKIRIELAELHSQEFTYKNIMQKTRVRRRDQINLIINELMNHGYLVRKKPVMLSENKDSYLSVYSYVDPGMVTYLTGTANLTEAQEGFRVEGYVQARLEYGLRNSNYKSELGYYKFHQIDSNDKVKYTGGEVDFIFKSGSFVLPIEVKKQNLISQIPTDNLLLFMKNKKIKLGLIIYGGVPHFDHKNNILYWPYWAI